MVSAGEMCRWMAKEAEKGGVEIFAGFPGVELLKDEKRKVLGLVTKARGVDKKGQPKSTFEDGVEIRAKVTVLAEGSRGI